DPAVEVRTLRLALQEVQEGLTRLREIYPAQSEYFTTSDLDLQDWANGDFANPNFGRSLSAFNLERESNSERIVFFPMSLQNGLDAGLRFEAFRMSVIWPDWLRMLEAQYYRNPSFFSARLLEHSSGYDSECATFFPETVQGGETVPTAF